jgi:Calx-beta domain/Carboxypeptidase regulatory-like domain
MKGLKNLFLLAVVTLAFGIITASAQVTVTGSTGANASYTTVKGAFDAINAAGTQAGNNILVDISASTTETATASLNASDWTTLTVRPSAVATVTGSIIGSIIKLNGADNVTIDGRIGGVGSSRDLTVSNSSTSGSTTAIWLASVAAGNGASNNVVRNLEIACGATQNTLTVTTIGILMGGTTISTSAADGNDNDNNQFLFNRIIRSRYGIVTRGLTTNLNINPVVADNIIGPAAFGADQIGKVGIFMQADTGATVTRNTVQFVGGDFANTTGGGDRVGIGIGQESWSMAPGTLTSNTYTVTKNIIHDVIEERTFSAVGLLLGTTGGGVATNNLVANNFIYNVKANGTSGDHTVGLGISGGHTDIVAHNSIRLSGDVDPNAGATATGMFGSGIRIANANSASHANLTLSNNSIFMDLSSSSTATARYYAISGPSNAYSFGTGGENRNNVYINPGNTQVQTGGLGTAAAVTLTTQFATLALWQAAYTVPQDAASIQADPQYLSATDLHIASTSPNESIGTLIAGITDDIDGNVRAGATDLGADEITLAGPGTLQFSSATYASNEGTTATITVNRISGLTGAVSVNYATSPGTATPGTCGTDDYVAASGTLNWANGDNAAKTFNVVLCTDLVTDPAETVVLTLSSPVGTTITGTNPATLTIGDVPPPFNGPYTVGAGGNYPSLTNAGGIFEAINLGGASGPVTINITSDLTGETGAVALNPIAGNPAVLIKPSGAARTISGIAPIAVIRINGADNVRIDGSSAASVVGGNPTLRELTVQNLSTSTSSGVIHIGSATESSTGNTVKNVIVLGSSPIQTLLGISVGAAGVGSQAAFNNNNTRIENCSVSGAIFGIFSSGVTLTPNTGTVITQNDLSTVAPNQIGRGGIIVINEDGVQITQNSIGGISNTVSADTVGIGLGAGVADAQISTTATTSGGITNAMVARNKINGVNGASTVGFSASGIALAGGAGGANTIANNMISGVTSPSTSPDFPSGIFVAGVTGSVTRIYYNSISMTGNRDPLVAAQMPGYGIAITGVDPTVELKNNIFYTTQTSSGGGVNALSYAIGMVTTTFANLDSNYNDFFSSGANDGGFRSGSLGSAAGTSYPDVTAWSTAVADDTNSVTIGEVDPLFVNPASNLRIPVTSPVIDKGIAVSVLDDFDGAIRSLNGFVGGVPDLGADEFLAIPTAATSSIRGRLLTPTGRGLLNAVVVLTNTNTGEVRTARSTSLGYFNIQDLPTGNFYIINVQSKRYQFTGQSFTLNENLDNLVLTANEGQSK